MERWNERRAVGLGFEAPQGGRVRIFVSEGSPDKDWTECVHGTA